VCVYTNAYSTVVGICEAKQSCLLSADIATFGYICSDFESQLFVQYQCVPDYFYDLVIKPCGVDTVPVALESICPADLSVNEGTWCDGDSLTLTCPIGKVIQIVCSYYGGHPSQQTCVTQSNVVCYIKNPTKLALKCNNKTSCSLNGSPDFVYDLIKNDLIPCDEIIKALYIQWKCV
jgi:hypothetical protein